MYGAAGCAQVLKGEGEGVPTISQTVKSLMKENGWKGFYKGLGPRFISMSLWGTSMITTYEFLSEIPSPFAIDSMAPKKT